MALQRIRIWAPRDEIHTLTALSLMESQYELDSKEVTEDACPWRGLISRSLICSSDCKEKTVKVWIASRGCQGRTLYRVTAQVQPPWHHGGNRGLWPYRESASVRQGTRSTP